jgi:hypothetical protein
LLGFLSFLGMANFLRLSRQKRMIKKPRIDAAARQNVLSSAQLDSRQTELAVRRIDMKPAVQSLDHVESLLISTGRDVDHRKGSRCFDKPLSHYRKYLVLLASQEGRRRMALWRS